MMNHIIQRHERPEPGARNKRPQSQRTLSSGLMGPPGLMPRARLAAIRRRPSYLASIV